MTFGAGDVQGLAARVVLEDCHTCLKRLEDEDDNTLFRINWVAMCAMLRTVGHVLSKVDRSRVNTVAKKLIDKKWKEWKTLPSHSIFPKFIEDERNAVIKE